MQSAHIRESNIRSTYSRYDIYQQIIISLQTCLFWHHLPDEGGCGGLVVIGGGGVCGGGGGAGVCGGGGGAGVCGGGGGFGPPPSPVDVPIKK